MNSAQKFCCHTVNEKMRWPKVPLAISCGKQLPVLHQVYSQTQSFHLEKPGQHLQSKTGHEHHDGLGQVAGTHHGQQISLVDGHLLLMHTHALLNAVQIPHDGGPLYGNGAVQLALST